MSNELPDLNGIGPLQSDDKPAFELPKSEPKKKKKTVSKRKSPACKLLNEQLYQDKIKTATNRHTVVYPEHHENSATAVEKCIIAYINRLRGCYAWKINTTGTKRKTAKGESWANSSATNGVSDVESLIKGRYLAIEVKFSKTDKQRPGQKRFEDRVKQAGGHYIIVRNFTHFRQEFLNLWEQWNK